MWVCWQFACSWQQRRLTLRERLSALELARPTTGLLRCAPYGYYGPDYFVSGVFIGAGPWFHSFYGRPGFYGRGYYGRGYYGRGFEGRDFDHDRGFRGREGFEHRGFD